MRDLFCGERGGREFARTLGVSTSAESRYEHDQATLPLDVVLRIAHVYQVSLLWLLTGCGDMFDGTEPELEGVVAEVAPYGERLGWALLYEHLFDGLDATLRESESADIHRRCASLAAELRRSREQVQQLRLELARARAGA